jgi:hypothetical protein
MSNVDSARCAIQKSPGSQAFAFITASSVRWVVRQVLRTAFYFIPSAMTGFIVSVFPFRNRVSSKEAFERLELGEGKPSRLVLRGRAAARPPGYSVAIRLLREISPVKSLPSSDWLVTAGAFVGTNPLSLSFRLPVCP